MLYISVVLRLQARISSVNLLLICGLKYFINLFYKIREVFMQLMTLSSKLIPNIENWAKKPVVHRLTFCLCLSCFYAICSHCVIPLPTNLVPVTWQSVAFLFCAWIFGYSAVNAYLMYITKWYLVLHFFQDFGQEWLICLALRVDT